MCNTLQDMIKSANSGNLFMQCNKVNSGAFRPLPTSFTVRLCRRDELNIWKEMWAQGKYMEFVNDYYNKVYAKYEDEFFSRCMFVVDENDNPVATNYIWRSYGKINTVGWFHTLPEYEGRGIGRGLFSEVLKNTECPIYVHTHPVAKRAIKLYSDFGFKLLTNSFVGYRENNLQESLPYLKTVLPEKDYKNLQTTEANPDLLEAALSNKLAEF